MWHKAAIAVQEGVRELFPAYFSLVMATGIVSIACHLMGIDFLAFPLFYVNLFFYFWLWVFTVFRVVFYPKRILSDLSNHQLSAGYLTLTAGTNVLGSQFVILFDNQKAALLLWVLGLALWLFLIYALFTLMTTKAEKPPLEKGINGAWLIIVVSTQSIAVLGMLIVSTFKAWENIFTFTMLCFYLLGCMLNILIISLIFYRFMFFKLDLDELTPPYWINMGAVAITTLAGANLLLFGHTQLLNELVPFIKGFTMFFWVSGTWWIPLLLLLGAWRHIIKRYPLFYHPLYWGLVFPIGMYSVCTFQLAKAIQVDFLYMISRFFVYLAVFSWLAVFIGFILHLTRKLSALSH